MLLFAAYDNAGGLRFIGDVPRGAACGCFCPACGCPLVAKQGDEVQWHFAHEGSNERPECAVGAANLLRRLAVEAVFLAAQQQELPFQPFRTLVEAPPGSAVAPRPVEWSVSPVGVLAWHADARVGESVATLELPDGQQADLRIAIDAHPPPGPGGAVTNGDVAQGWFVAPAPPLEALRHHDAVLHHFRQTGRYIWRQLPDTLGLVSRCRRELQHEADSHRLAAGRKWAAIRNRASTSGPGDELEPDSAPSVAPVRHSLALAQAPAWAPDQKPGAVYHFRKLTDDTRWVAYEAAAGGMLLAPYPVPFDGWDEYFPPRLAVADGDGRSVLRVLDFNALLLFFRDKTAASRITSSAAEFAGL